MGWLADHLGAISVVALTFGVFLLPAGTGLGGGNDRLTWAAVLVIGLAVIPGVSRFPSGFHVPSWYLLYLAALLASALLSPSAAGWAECRRQLVFLALVFAVSRHLVSVRAMTIVLAAIVGSASLTLIETLPASLEATADRLTDYSAVSRWSGYPELGMLACLGAAATMATFAVGRPKTFRVASLVLAVAFTGEALLLYSRSAWITIALVGIWLMAVTLVRWRSLAMGLLLLGLVGGVAVGVSVSPLLRHYVSTLGEASHGTEFTSRLHGWQAAYAMLRDRPWLGVGPGNYMGAYPKYSPHQDPVHAYNIVLHNAAELGVLGLAAYLALWIRAALLTFRLARRPETRTLGFALHAMFLAFFVRSLSEHFLANLNTGYRFLLLLAIMFGLVEAAARVTRQAVPALGPPDDAEGRPEP